MVAQPFDCSVVARSEMSFSPTNREQADAWRASLALLRQAALAVPDAMMLEARLRPGDADADDKSAASDDDADDATAARGGARRPPPQLPHVAEAVALVEGARAALPAGLQYDDLCGELARFADRRLELDDRAVGARARKAADELARLCARDEAELKRAALRLVASESLDWCLSEGVEFTAAHEEVYADAARRAPHAAVDAADAAEADADTLDDAADAKAPREDDDELMSQVCRGILGLDSAGTPSSSYGYRRRNGRCHT